MRSICLKLKFLIILYMFSDPNQNSSRILGKSVLMTLPWKDYWRRSVWESIQCKAFKTNYEGWKRTDISAAQDGQRTATNEDGPDCCCESVAKYDLLMSALYTQNSTPSIFKEFSVFIMMPPAKKNEENQISMRFPSDFLALFPSLQGIQKHISQTIIKSVIELRKFTGLSYKTPRKIKNAVYRSICKYLHGFRR